MARTESRTNTGIWSDKEFCALSADASRLYWVLYSQPTISLCGVVALTERRWVQTARTWTLEIVSDALAELVAAGYVLVDIETQEVLVRTFAKHDHVQRNHKTWGPAWRLLANIVSPTIRSAAEDALWALGDPPEDVLRDMPNLCSFRSENELGDTPSSGSPSFPCLQPLPLPLPHPPDEAAPADAVAESFTEFWKAYPHKVGKPGALKAWKRVKSSEVELVMGGVAAWSKHWRAAGKPLDYIPHPATWLNDRRWEDTPATAGSTPRTPNGLVMDAYGNLVR